MVYIFAVCQCEDCEYADMSLPHANDEYYEMKTKMKLNPLIPRTGIITFLHFVHMDIGSMLAFSSHPI